MTQERLGFMNKETFMDLPERDKWGVLFDYMVGKRIDEKIKCESCVEDFDRRYEAKKSFVWKASYIGIIAVSSAFGGFFAQLFGYSAKVTGGK